MKIERNRVYHHRGYALITVLLMVALMSIMIIGIFVLVKDDRVRARGYMEVGRSRFLTDMATQEVLAKIMDGSKVPWEDGKAIGSYTAAPGVIEMRKYREPINKGYHKTRSMWTDPNAWGRNPFAHEYEHRGAGDWRPANPLTISLFSRRWYAPSTRYMTSHAGNVSDGNPDYNPARTFNLNTPNNPFAPGSLYISGSPDESVLVKDLEAELGNWAEKDKLLKRNEIDGFRFQPGEAAVDRPLNIQWLPIYKFADKGNVYRDELGRTRRNPIVGRYSYWVDVENTKVNVNVADRNFVDSSLASILGETEALNSRAGDSQAFYFIQNPNARDPSTSDAVQVRGKIERTLMNSNSSDLNVSPTTTIIDSAEVSRGDNTAAVTYFNLWMDWQKDGTPPYLADNSLVDWRAFTGLRPLAGGLGEDTTIEGLLVDAAEDTENSFNTFAEVFSLLDPKTEERDFKLGLTALTAMRRTYGNAATIYGWDEERDPLGLPKIDIVKLQIGGVDGPLFRELSTRLEDPDYYMAYHLGANPSAKSFASGFNPLVGDNNPANDANGKAAVRQMLVNIVDYGKPHDEPPFLEETSGIIGAKSMPYVIEMATRARNGFWRLYDPEESSDAELVDGEFDVMARDFAQKVEELKDAYDSKDLAAIDEKLQAVLNFNDPAGTFVARLNGKTLEEILTGVTIDLNAGMANPNPFAEKPEIPGSRRNSYFSGKLTLDYEWNGITPIEPAESKEAEFEGLFVSRSIPVTASLSKANPRGIRVDGESVYFDLGMIPGETLNDPANTTALRIKGWEISRSGGGIFHKVPLRHLGQTSEPRPWWAMAQPDTNPGMISSRGRYEDHPDQFSLAHYFQPYNLEGFRQWLIPNVPVVAKDKSNPPVLKPAEAGSDFPYEEWKHVSVGWFTARTIAEFCRAHDEDTVKRGLAGCLYVSENGWDALTTGWTTVRANPDPDTMNDFLKEDGEFAGAIQTLIHIADSVDRKVPSMVERVVSLDPTVGHRTGNPDAFQRADGGHYVPEGVQLTDVGHFYGTNGHTWRHGANAPGAAIDSPPPRQEEPGPPKRVPIHEPIFEDQELTYRTPVGNTFVTTTKTIRVKTGERVVGYRLVYPHKQSPSSKGPKRQGYHLTEDFYNPALTTVSQKEIYGSIFQHHPLQTGWEVEAAPGVGTTKVGQARWNAGPWNAFFTSAPKGDLMVSIGEIGFCHSGLMGRPIELIKEPFTRKDSYRGGQLKAPYVGSPEYGLPPTMLLDLLTPGAFRNNVTGERYTENQWRSGVGANTPDNPRRGVWNINAVPASDTYMAMRQGDGSRWNSNADHQSRHLKNLPLHPTWAPNGHGMRVSWGEDRNWLDPMMNPFPRYRRGFESWLSIMVGDYTPFRSRGEAIWGRVESGGAYAVLSAPWYSWRVGVGGGVDPDDPTVPFDPEYSGSASSLMAMGRISVRANRPPGASGPRWTKDGAKGLFYSDQNYDTSQPYRNASVSLDDTARVGNFALRHHNSEMIKISSQDISKLHTALNPKHSSVGWTKIGGGYHHEKKVTYGFLRKYGTYFQPYKGFASTRIYNSHPGGYASTGIYANAPAVLSANQVSTAANVFTAHIVTQAIRDNGKEREDFSLPPENTNTGLGFMDHDDEVLGEQWTQVVIARIPAKGKDPETGGPKYDYRVLYSRTLDHQAQ